MTHDELDALEAARLHEEICQDVAPDLGRAIARLEAWCAEQDTPLSPGEAGPAIYYADVRALIAAARPEDTRVNIEAAITGVKPLVDAFVAETVRLIRSPAMSMLVEAIVTSRMEFDRQIASAIAGSVE